MFAFLLVLSILSPTGDVQTGTKPFNTLEECREAGAAISQTAKEAGYFPIGLCIPRDAWQANT